MEETQDTPQRLFFALWPSDEERRALVRWREGQPLSGGRPVPSRNLHLTLAFAGDVDAATRDCLEQGAQQVRGAPFRMTLDRIGLFKRGLFWTGPSLCPPALGDLAAALAGLLADCGLEPDPRPFHPHVTLIRRLPGRLPEVSPPGGVWEADAFCLVCSRPGEGYEVLRTYPLGDSPPGSLSERSGSMG
ncbi:RNA 2',3'-cyclic phosphodiesterase [Thioalkalivibrio sulfidiphilus]|uniref:RNA 2',3'-cyclic phosphodiesterase n=1 Tax=Thioalkalivibrio sulfidiphilus TaxID=1033854 RepID=UPI00035C7377|nr:RNA 2',3'-cyclic phosphodiesterase [Thioalkalivibrio sulfidiphilus]